MQLEEVVRGVERLIIVASAPALLWIGFRLFVMGATGAIQLDARVNSWKAKLTNLSPGLICFALSVGLSVHVLNSKITSTTTTNNAGDTTKITAWFGGDADKLPDSLRIRLLYGEVLVCETEGKPRIECMNTLFFTRYQRPIDRETLTKFQSLENQIRAGGANADSARRELDALQRALRVSHAN